MFDGTVYNQYTVIRKAAGKFTERVADIVNILEKVQMIFFYIKYDFDFGIEF